MILTDYYRFERVAGAKAKTRIACTASTKSYNPFEMLRAGKAIKKTERYDGCNVGDLFVYYGNVPASFGGDSRRKAGKALTKGNNISSIYMPEPQSNFGYGDMRDTADALLFEFHDVDVINGRLQDGAVIEIFVARGGARDSMCLYNQLLDGTFDEEMNMLRKQAMPE